MILILDNLFMIIGFQNIDLQYNSIHYLRRSLNLWQKARTLGISTLHLKRIIIPNHLHFSLDKNTSKTEKIVSLLTTINNKFQSIRRDQSAKPQ